MERRMLRHRVHFDEDFSRGINETFDVEYYLLQTLKFDTSYNALAENEYSMYGVEIRKVKDGILQESSSDYNVSRSEDRAKSLIDLLSANSVTPDSLEFIMSDNK